MAEETTQSQAAASLTLGEAPVVETRKSFTAPALPAGQHWFWGTGRRKKSTARVRIRPGKGEITVNERAYEKFFVSETDRRQVLRPLSVLDMLKSWDIFVNVSGGGSTGQAGAVSLGLARAISKALPDAESALRDQGLLTRDARMKERKKYGQKGARKRFQFSKR